MSEILPLTSDIRHLTSGSAPTGVAGARCARAARIGSFARRCERARFQRDVLPVAHLADEQGLGEIEALRVADAGCRLQIREFLERLDALGDHGHAERGAQGFDRLEHVLAARPLMNARSILISSAVMSASAESEE